MTEYVTVPKEPSREQQLAMQRALLDNYPVIHDGEVCTSAAMLGAIYDAALSASPAPGGEVREALVRVEKFVGEWPKSRKRNDTIYGLHMGDERECELLCSDLRRLISLLYGESGR